MTVKELAKAMQEIAELLVYESETLEQYHAYAQMFDFSPGSNIFIQVLEDALAFRESSFEELKAAIEDTKDVE